MIPPHSAFIHSFSQHIILRAYPLVVPQLIPVLILLDEEDELGTLLRRQQLPHLQKQVIEVDSLSLHPLFNLAERTHQVDQQPALPNQLSTFLFYQSLLLRLVLSH